MSLRSARAIDSSIAAIARGEVQELLEHLIEVDRTLQFNSLAAQVVQIAERVVKGQVFLDSRFKQLQVSPPRYDFAGKRNSL